MPSPKPRCPKLPRELFGTRTHVWTSPVLGEKLESRGQLEAVPSRYRPSVSLEEVEPDRAIFRLDTAEQESAREASPVPDRASW